METPVRRLVIGGLDRSDIFALPVFDAYQFGMFQLRDEIVSLYTAPEGARDWTRRTSARLPAAATEKLNRPETKIINLTAVTVGSPELALMLRRFLS